MAGWGPFDLTGKNAIVTGGATGIGFGIASRLTEAGANVLVGDLDESAAKKSIEGLAGHRGTAVATRADVSDPTTGAELAERCASEFGSVDILVNNAGVYPLAPFTEITPEFFDRTVAVNYRGLLFTSQGVTQKMAAQGSGGVIINIASIEGLHPTSVGLAVYGSTKGAVISLTRSMAFELASNRIRVVSITPGGTATAGAMEMFMALPGTDEERQARLETTLAKLPAGRMGTPDDIANVAVFLASSAADYITGENVVVDGGWLLT